MHLSVLNKLGNRLSDSRENDYGRFPAYDNYGTLRGIENADPLPNRELKCVQRYDGRCICWKEYINGQSSGNMICA